ncbi:tyrosine-protein phosphatase [Rhodotorula toruloides]|uniref:protein-tyrosine-phosphatase n=1 Tax=Rhodotorula toruloides TaxID=5286 RepID=A0A511K7C0_RHOTO|nr:tyrosine-protein phosphatase [Rhodotorula toruloides]
MFKQQADEMREQMRGGRGMKRRTSIPRLNLVKSGAALAQPANLDNLAPASSDAGAASAISAVQLIRAHGIEREGDGDALEEFPYAFGPREILPGVFLGSEQNAKDPAVLRDWKIGFVLNVAKEVDCPWTSESSDEELDAEVEQIGESRLDEAQDAAPIPQPVPRPPSSPRPSASKHRRTKTQAVISYTYIAPAPPKEPSPPRVAIRPAFIRPTTSTPNLHASFQPLSPAPVPHIPSPVGSSTPVRTNDLDTPQRSILTSPPHSRRSTPRLAPTRAHTHPQTTTRSADAVRFPPNQRSGRPELEYLWLKWGHDEADLVEAQKFQAAFDFLDEARERGERTLVHCQCGVSRSATVVIAYCMREAAKALEEGRDAKELAGCTGMHDTYSFVKEKSEWVGPNLSLVFQLVAYERTLRGDSGNEDDAYAHSAYLPEPSQEDDQGLPPPTPADSFRPFAFPLPSRLQSSYPSPRTPMSEGSMADSQLSTPDLHDPLVSPTFSIATRTSSVTSTPLSVDRNLPPSVRVVRSDDGVEQSGRYRQNGIRDRHSSLETVVAEQDEDEEREEDKIGKGAFVLSVPPLPAFALQYSELASPTIAVRPHQQRSEGDILTQIAPPPRSSSLRPADAPATALDGLPPLAMPKPTAGDPASPGYPPSSLRRESLIALTSPLSATSTISSATPLSSGGLGRTNSGRRFGAGQTPTERKASHRRVCSDTIRVPSPHLFSSTGSTGAGTSPLSVSTPELESSPVRTRSAEEDNG